MAVVSSTVNSGELATATQYNNLRTDAVGSTGHDHGSGQGNATISATTFDGTATVSGAWNFTGAVGIDSSVDADVTDFDLASSGDIDLVSTNNAVGAIYLRANAGTSETIKIHSDQGTSVTEAAESITILSDAGGVGIRSAANLANAVNITVDGGTTSTMTLFNDQGTAATEGSASIQLLSDVGGINVKSGLNGANAILLTADGGTSETIVIHADQGTGTGSIELLSDDGGIELDAGTDIILDAGGADIFLKDDGTLFGTLNNNSGELLIKSSSSGTTAATFTGANVVFAGTVTTTDVITGGTVEATTDTAAADNAAMGYTSAEGLILTGQGSTTDVTIKNDADATVLSILTGTTNVTLANSLFLAEQAEADADVAGEGQIWVDTATPNVLMFTDDAGTDFTVAHNATSALSSLVTVSALNSGSITSGFGSIDTGSSNITTTGTVSAEQLTTTDDLALSSSGGIINFNDDVSITHASNSITVGGGDLLVGDGFGIVVGYTGHISTAVTSELQVVGAGGGDAGLALARFSANASSGFFEFVKSRSGTVGTASMVSDNDDIGIILWLPSDSSGFTTQAAQFHAEVDDGSPADGDIGMAFVLSLIHI